MFFKPVEYINIMNEHYFTENPESKFIVKKLNAVLRGIKMEFYNAAGLFSVKKLDIGTELLINKCIIFKDQAVLDLGCGCGIVGLALKLYEPSLKLTFSDINQRAIEITRKNLKMHNLIAKTVQSNIFDKINYCFDNIILNPPQTAGKNICFKMIKDSKEHLNNNGLLQIVARHNKGGKELSKKMLEVFNNVQSIGIKSGYRIYISFKKVIND